MPPSAEGLEACRRRAGLVDACVAELAAEAGAPPGVALLALGGYGRAELAPFSDLDLLLVHRDGDEEILRAFAEHLLYPLWDAGFDVGHAVRTVEGSLAVAEERLDAGAALLDARLLAGDSDLGAELIEEARAWARRNPRRFAGVLFGDLAARRERFGSVSHLLEPDLKQGAGGLRDLHALGWLRRALPGADQDAPALDALETSGLLRAGERSVLEAAWVFITRVRCALQRAAGRKAARVRRDLQPQLARDLGFRDEPSLAAQDGLMRTLFEHARQVEHVAGLVFERFLREDVPPREPEIGPTLESVLNAFAGVAEGRLALTPTLLDRVEAVTIPDVGAWSEAARDAFLRIVRAGEGGIRALEAMDRMGLLAHALPEWAPVRCRPQRDPYHRFSVDVHLLETLAGMARLLDGGDPADPVALQALEWVRDRDALLLGALLHDVGKIGEGGHVAAGSRQAAAALDRMGIPEATREVALFMVSEHLLLPDTATRRDLGDDDLVLDVAAKVGDATRLAALYLLVVADAAATGPAAWTSWRQALVRELVAKVHHVLERGEMGEEIAERLAARVEDLRRLLSEEDPAQVERFVLRMPRSYVLTVGADRAAAHFRLLVKELGEREVRTDDRPGAKPGTHEVTVVTPDRPGLLSSIAGALALAGLSILEAQVFTTSDGVALDLFEVEGAFEREIKEERWGEFREAVLDAVQRGPEHLERLLNDKRRHYPPPRPGIPVEVSVDNAASDFFTVVEVGAADRIGLLHDITRAFTELGLDVHLAKVGTYGERVIDAFYVRDALGRKVEEPDRVAEIERATAARLSA